MSDHVKNYWRKPNNHQLVKHNLIRQYLSAWFPKLGYSNGRIQYFDTHAGRGKYDSGEPGSPIIAIQTLLRHSHVHRILAKCEVRYWFIEEDDENLSSLEQEVAALGTLPSKLVVQCYKGDSTDYLADLLHYMESNNAKLAPAFALIDPYSYQIPGDGIRRLMKHESVEIFVNVMWREHDMARINAASRPGGAFEKQMDGIFPGVDWKSEIDNSAHVDQRIQQTVELFGKLTNARWATHIRMLGENGATRYMLLHLTNHDDGRDIMKDCIWKVCPDGGFYARVYEEPTEYLIRPDYDRKPIKKWIMSRLKDGDHEWKTLSAKLRGTIWRGPQLNKVLKELRDEKKIGYSGQVGPAANPRIEII